MAIGAVIWTTLALGALAGIAPVLREVVRPRIDGARDTAPGAFAALSRGRTHYRWHGPEGGPVTVCVHGLTTPSFVWEGLVPGLVAKGHRVLTYDLYGRGYSDRPGGAQEAGFFVGQLEELLVDQGVDGPVTLVGYSMGGAIAAGFAARHPDRLRELVLIAPAGLGHDLGPVARLVARGGVVGRWLMLAVFPMSFRRGCEAEREVPTTVPGIVDRQQAELRWRGFVPAVARSVAGILAETQDETHAAIARSGVPVRAIWGAKDTVIPLSRKARLAEVNPDAYQYVIEGAGHGLTYTHTDRVLAAIMA
ncbi:alpha/beta hydrolase [Roseovarius sp. A46]|uniref:alpha/beta fold hydrolase n=1 Tax=Roseovarius sp. A46 TaxID=2109331 RepID=UPI001011E26F|nr:alpha/beta fold hydrolase [Roseovarius sp. A46]RXV61168.1 alpha/beta hydrolase [Roseovarius sp. A46]